MKYLLDLYRSYQGARITQDTDKGDIELESHSNSIVSIRDTSVWKMTSLLCWIKLQFKRLLLLVTLAPKAFRIGGGPLATLNKALSLYKFEGNLGLRRGLFKVRADSLVNPVIGSNGFQREHSSNPSIVPIKKTHPVGVIVPVYLGIEMTQRCIESAMPGVLKVPGACLIVINDASPDEGMKDMLDSLLAKWPEQFNILHNNSNYGFVKTVNRGLAYLEKYDVVLLNSDVVVPKDWLVRLRDEAYSRPNVGTVTPFSNNATICSFPFFNQENSQPFGLKVDEIDDVFRNEKLSCIEAPTGVGFCMYIRRACLNKIGVLNEKFGRGYGEENDLCQRALKSGWDNLITPNLYVFHEGGASFSTEKEILVEHAMGVMSKLHPQYHNEVALFIRADPLRSSRIIRHLQLIAILPRLKLLFVSHNLGGGVAQHVDELAAHLGETVGCLLLRPLNTHTLELRIGVHDNADSLQFAEQDYQTLLTLLRAVGVSCVHFHHTIGLPENVLELPRELDAKWLITVHDYYWLNGNPTLTGADYRYQGYSDLVVHPTYQLPDGTTPLQWRECLRSWIEDASCVIFPSTMPKALFESYFHIKQAVIAAHPEMGRDVCAVLLKPWRHDKPLVIGVLGALGREKGADFLEELAVLAHALGKSYVFRLLGYAYRPLRSVVATGPYKRQELYEMIEQQGCGLIFFPAQWPETYSYTLSCALQSGLPIIAPNLGAFPERVSGRANTSLINTDQTAQQILTFIDEFIATLDSGQILSAPIWTGEPAQKKFYDEAYSSIISDEVRYVSDVQTLQLEELVGHLSCELLIHPSWREQIMRFLWHCYMNQYLHQLARMVPRKMRHALARSLSQRPMHNILRGR